jgi:hypothetical protein
MEREKLANHYFEHLKEHKKEENSEEVKRTWKTYLESLRELTGDHKTDLDAIKLTLKTGRFWKVPPEDILKENSTKL